MSSGSEHSPDRLAALTGALESGRSANVESIGPAVAKLPVDIFIKHVLPPPHKSFTPAKVRKILKELTVKHRGLQTASYSSKDQRWTAFDEVKKATEHATYQALVTISNQITAEVKKIFDSKTPKQLFDFVNEGNAAPKSAGRPSTSKPDAYFVLRDEFRQAKGETKGKGKEKGKEKTHWMDIGPTGEYKLDNSEKVIQDNLNKILWNLTHTMREDARRRFAFAFTIEGTSMRLWYASRADILMSDTFDFMEEPEILLRFFLAFLYATEAQAGWDPTMVCEWDGTTPQYIITVHDAAKKKHKYKTVEMLSDIGAGSLRGRGTRVWKVTPYGKSPANTAGGSKKAELVLKDCWVDKGAGKEGDIITAILADAQKKVDEWEKILALHENDRQKLDGFPEEVKFTKDDLEELTKSLLLPSMHSEVLLGNVVIEPDKTLDRANLWTGDEIPYHRLWDSATKRDAKSEAKKSTLQEQLKGEHRSVYLCHRGRDEPIMYNEKVHYRVVFEDLCQPIRDEPFLHRAYMYLAMSCQALRLLHKAGWVHRDISVGNILISPGPTVKLADFEYAKRMTSEEGTSHDICTGTRDFMAVEVQKTKYLFLPPEPPSEDESDYEPDFRLKDNEPKADKDFRPDIDLADRPVVRVKIPWLYNPIHDLESLMWLANYFTMGKTIEFQPIPAAITDANVLLDNAAIVPETQEDREKRIIRQDNYASNLFYQTTYREDALRSLEGWEDLIHPALREAGILLTLNTVRSRLVARYVEVEKNISVTGRQVLAGQRLYKGMVKDFISSCRHMERFSHHAVMVDLAREADKIRGKKAVPVAQLHAMSLQDDSPPGGSDAPDSTSSVIPPDANPVAALGSSKTEKSSRKARQQVPSTAPTRIQPKRNLPKTQ